MKKIALIALACMVAATALWWFNRKPPLLVHYETASNGPVESMVSNTRSGTVKACHRSRLSMPIGGMVDTLNVKEGDQVEAGQVLMTFWNRDRAANLERAQAAGKAAAYTREQACTSAAQADRENERMRTLLARKLVSTESAETADTLARTRRQACQAAQEQLAAALADQGMAKAQLDLTVLKAPFAGIVAEVNGEIGEYVTPSPPGIPTPPAVDLIDNRCLYVTAPIDEIDASRLQDGQVARITLDAFGDQVFTGKLVRIAPYVLELEKQARTVDVDVQFDVPPQKPPLLVGYSADVEIILEHHPDVLRIPTVALMEGHYVLTPDASGQRLERREIRIGLSNWHFTEVLSGLKAGDRVITSLGQPGVAAGAKVTLAP